MKKKNTITQNQNNRQRNHWTVFPSLSLLYFSLLPLLKHVQTQTQRIIEPWLRWFLSSRPPLRSTAVWSYRGCHFQAHHRAQRYFSLHTTNQDNRATRKEKIGKKNKKKNTRINCFLCRGGFWIAVEFNLDWVKFGSSGFVWVYSHSFRLLVAKSSNFFPDSVSLRFENSRPFLIDSGCTVNLIWVNHWDGLD